MSRAMWMNHIRSCKDTCFGALNQCEEQAAELRPASRDMSSIDALQLRSRMEQLEASLEQLLRREEQGIAQRFNDMDKAHLSSLQRFAQLEQRLMRMETGIAAPKAKAFKRLSKPFTVKPL